MVWALAVTGSAALARASAVRNVFVIFKPPTHD
jgi:hypothetical protein